MPSEQLAGRPVFASDLYSLGLTAIYLLTGRQPQQLDSDPMTGSILWQQYAPAVNPALTALLDRTIHMNVSQRYQTAQEMLTALTATLGEQTVLTAPPTQLPTPTPTVMSAPPSIPNTPTQVVVPQSIPSAPMSAQSVPMQRLGGGEWKIAVGVGGIIGASILGGAFLLRGSFSTPSTNQTQNKPEATASVAVSPSPTVSASPSVSPSAVAPPSPSPPSVTPAPVQPEPPPRSADPPPRSIEPDPRPRSIEPDPPQRQVDSTNATIVGQSGSKNIRSGPGTRFASQHIAYPGDRVRIIGSDRDEGGYVWYKVAFPKSGAEGWIAGQLLNPDQ